MWKKCGYSLKLWKYDVTKSRGRHSDTKRRHVRPQNSPFKKDPYKVGTTFSESHPYNVKILKFPTLSGRSLGKFLEFQHPTCLEITFLARFFDIFVEIKIYLGILRFNTLTRFLDKLWKDTLKGRTCRIPKYISAPRGFLVKKTSTYILSSHHLFWPFQDFVFFIPL